MTKSMLIAHHRVVGTVLVAVLWSAVVQHPLMQTPPTGAWSGWARCQIDVQGPGYTEHQIHTWMIAGGTPTVEGAFRVYPGTWSVVGGGTLQRTQGTQILNAQWAINVPSMSAPIAVFVRADGRMFIQARHAQLRSAGAVAGYQQQTIDGKAQPPAQISGEAFEWAFPVIDGASTSTSVSGSSAPGVNGSVGYMQPAGTRGTASCAWQFGQGAAAPAPPSFLAAQAIPTPSSTAQTPAVSSQSASTATTIGSTTGIRVIGGTTGVVSDGSGVVPSDASGAASCTSTSCTLADIAAAFDALAQSVQIEFAKILRELDSEANSLKTSISLGGPVTLLKQLELSLNQVNAERDAASKDEDKVLADIASGKQQALNLGAAGDWQGVISVVQNEIDGIVANYVVPATTAPAPVLRR